MRDTTHIPVFPSTAGHVSATPERSGNRLRGANDHAQGSTMVAAFRRLLAGVCVGLMLVGGLWYLMQIGHQTSALTAASRPVGVPQGVTLVTVGGGDTLWGLAQAHRPDWVGQEQWVDEVAAYIQIDADALFPGQILAIPTY